VTAELGPDGQQEQQADGQERHVVAVGDRPGGRRPGQDEGQEHPVQHRQPQAAEAEPRRAGPSVGAPGTSEITIDESKQAPAAVACGRPPTERTGPLDAE
jgi:hypothetical protein